MKIAVNTIFLQKDRLEGYGYFVQEIFIRLAKKYPEHEFIFIFDRPFDQQFIFSPNIKPFVVKPAARHAFSFKYWYDIKLPLALKSIKPDILIQPYGFCSLTSYVPQILVVHDLAFKHFPKFIPKHHLYYYRAFTKKFLNKAKKVVTVSEFSKDDIIWQYQIAPEKINVIFSAAKNTFQPIDISAKQITKEKYSDGKEYFLFTGGIHPRKNLITLLKAFSLFKKWQRSNMKLLVAGRLAWQYEMVLEKLKTYKYRDDVVLLNYLPEEELANITASAYALVFPSLFEGFGVPVIEAMQCGIPVITSNTSCLPEISGGAALYADPINADAIATQMLQLYKDESLRNKLIEAGVLQARRYSWDKTADLFWQTITELAGN